jgi:casein kinase 1
MNIKEGQDVGSHKIVKQLGKGSFGTVYEAINTITGRRCALKVENHATMLDQSQLKNEYRVYKELKNSKGIADVYYFGIYNKNYYIVLRKLGLSTQEIFLERGKNFSIKTVCMIGKRMIDILEGIHSKKRIYRDIKPDNILIGDEDPWCIYLVDFGMSKLYIDERTGRHIPLLNNKKLTGTARYASVNTHIGLEQSRRDDLESLGYVLIYFARGTLPWMGINASTGKEKYCLIGEKKRKTSAQVLCKGMVGEKYFVEYINYVRGLKFEETPDYARLRSMLDKVLSKNNLADDGDFDWAYSKEKKSSTHPTTDNRRRRSLWKKVKIFIKKLKGAFE